jgi:hypothetical protein
VSTSILEIYLWYQEEEGERSDKWKDFLEQIAKSSQPCSSEEEYKETLHAEDSECKAETISESKEGDDSRSGKSIYDGSEESDPKKEGQLSKETNTHKFQTWAKIRPSLGAIEKMMSFRVQKRKNMIDEHETVNGNHLPSIEEAESLGGASDDEKDCVNEISDDNENAARTEPTPVDEVSPKHFFPWKEELESLVRGGVPKDLRGEVELTLLSSFILHNYVLKRCCVCHNIAITGLASLCRCEGAAGGEILPGFGGPRS